MLVLVSFLTLARQPCHELTCPSTYCNVSGVQVFSCTVSLRFPVTELCLSGTFLVSLDFCFSVKYFHTRKSRSIHNHSMRTWSRLKKNLWVVLQLCLREFLWPTPKHSVNFLRFHQRMLIIISTSLSIRQIYLPSTGNSELLSASTHQERRLELSSVQFSHSVVSNSLRPHEPQDARPPCSSPTPGVYPHSCPLSRWCHPTVSSSVVPFSSCPQSFPASVSFQMSQLFTSSGQSIGVSASTSVLPMNTQDWSPSDGLFGSPCSPRDPQESPPTPQFKSINSLVLSFLHSPTLTSIHDHLENHSLD